MSATRAGSWLLAALAAAVLAGAGTWALGWWGVPIAAALTVVALRRTRGAPAAAAAGAALAWGVLLAVDAAGGRMTALAGELAAVFGAPLPALVVLTLLFPALLAWSAAALVDVVLELLGFSRARDRAPAPHHRSPPTRT